MKNIFTKKTFRFLIIAFLITLPLLVPFVSDAATVELKNPLGDIKSPPQLFNNIINVVLGMVGILSVVMITYGGVTYLTSGGSEEKIRDAKAIITYSVIGLILVLCSWMIVNLVIKGLGAGA